MGWSASRGSVQQRGFRFVLPVSLFLGEMRYPGHVFLLAESEVPKPMSTCTSIFEASARGTCCGPVGQSKSRGQAQGQWGRKHTLPLGSKCRVAWPRAWVQER